MNYQETIDFLYAQLPLFSRIGAAAIKADLTNTLALCEALNNPQNKFKTVHIAGTNGKGSSSHMLAAILQQSCYKTGLYTSPHLYDFRERIKVNGELCTKEFVVEFTEKIKPYIETIRPSFFEVTVAMAFEYFAQQQVDIAIIETGLGGRLDSTNVILPEVCLITNIGKDHMDILGNTLEKIAFEKAGIIKENVPVVVSEILPETKDVFEEAAKEKHAPLIFAQDIFSVKNYHYELNGLQIEIADSATKQVKNYELDLTGIYQTKNIIGVLATIRQLQNKGWKIDEQSISYALKNVKNLTGLHGRWELVSKDPTIITDVGHNEDGIKQIVQQLKHIQYNRLHLIIGFVKDKDVSSALALLPKDGIYYFTKAQIPRAMNEKDLEILAAEKKLHGQTFENIDAALLSAKSNYRENDLILVCGSVFLVAEIKK
ncbi:MAG: bifunctional folylpolyglutamate synthase/dihydrofolate synthase [Arachidicoccus sp.]|nr:bifunctional folylpolyglutamate synthase/dihydrofolate synthase [Arachidicoccus sp.]